MSKPKRYNRRTYYVTKEEALLRAVRIAIRQSEEPRDFVGVTTVPTRVWDKVKAAVKKFDNGGPIEFNGSQNPLVDPNENGKDILDELRKTRKEE